MFEDVSEFEKALKAVFLNLSAAKLLKTFQFA
jgi:hypothetical protein